MSGGRTAHANPNNARAVACPNKACAVACPNNAFAVACPNNVCGSTRAASVHGAGKLLPAE